jgi:hypothetical protein
MSNLLLNFHCGAYSSYIGVAVRVSVKNIQSTAEAAAVV